MSYKEELALQENIEWNRGNSGFYEQKIVDYQVKVCLENSQKGSLLDLPCGDGFVTQMFMWGGGFSKIVGVDASSSHLNIAKSRLPEITFEHSLIEEYYPTKKFDNIFMLNILEHVIDPVATLSHIRKNILAESGVVVVQVPNAEAINRKIAVQMGTLTHLEELSPFDINVGHRRNYILETLVADVEKSGLQVIKSGGVFYKMLSTPQMNWFLQNGLWKEGAFGWGRVGSEGKKDWRQAFCDACYEIGEQYPRECNIIYVVAKII